MTRSRRPLGLFLVAACVGAAPVAATANSAAVTLAAVAPAAVTPATQDSEVQELFAEGVALLRRGDDRAALETFQRVLALDPSNEDALAIWQSTDQQVWLDMLVKEGQMELVAKTLMGQVEQSRDALRDDPDAIKDHLRAILSGDNVERRAAERALAADHGEYAVQYMLAGLADSSNEDRRVLFMATLTRMGPSVVPPLVEALESSEPAVRRGVAFTLGHIGDPRARGMLARLAENDDDQTVRDAAADALEKCGGDGGHSPTELLVEQGNLYLAGSYDVLAPHHLSDVVWHWADGGLAASPVPGLLFAPERAKQQFYRALATDPGAAPALAGLARASFAAVAALDAQAGSVDDSVLDSVLEGRLAALVAGPDALDHALAASIEAGDEGTSAAILGSLADTGVSTATVESALQNPSAVVADWAAVTLATHAARVNRAPAPGVVERLGGAASRQVLRSALVVDANAQRAKRVVDALGGLRTQARISETGASGLGILRRSAGVDLVVVADTLPDLTTAQVLADIESDPRFADLPVAIVSDDAETAEGVWGDRVDAVIVGDETASEGLEGLLEGRSTPGRERALTLARRAALALAELAAAGQDIGRAVPDLVQSLDMDRDDATVRPTVAALRLTGDASAVPGLAGIALDEEREDVTRSGAVDALTTVCGRARTVPAETLEVLLAAVMAEDLEPFVRRGFADAVGALALEPSTRAELASRVRVRISGGVNGDGR